MALVKCPECGHEVSEKAEACPNCGCPMNRALDDDMAEGVGLAGDPSSPSPEVPASDHSEDDDAKETHSAGGGKGKGRILLVGVGAVVAIVAFLFATHTICFHSWVPATCSDPKRCSICYRYEGGVDPDAHNWVEATCVQPRHCARCGVTEGEIAPENHRWSNTFDKGYAICELCGKTTGDVDAAFSSEISEGSFEDKGAVLSDDGENEAGQGAAGADTATLSISSFSQAADSLNLPFSFNDEGEGKYSIYVNSSLVGMLGIGGSAKYDVAVLVDSSSDGADDYFAGMMMLMFGAYDPSLKAADVAERAKDLLESDGYSYSVGGVTYELGTSDGGNYYVMTAKAV